MERTQKGKANITLYNMLQYNIQMYVKGSGEGMEAYQNISSLQNNNSLTIRPYLYTLRYKNLNNDNSSFTDIGSVKGKAGALSSITIQESIKRDIIAVIHEDITPNDVNMLLQIPQYLVVTLSEVFFIISGMAFAYSQAPATMKAVLQAIYLFTTSIGNLIVLIIAKVSGLDAALEFFIFAGIMVFTMFVYMLMAKNYKYIDHEGAVEYDKHEDPDEIEMNNSTHNEFHNPSFIENEKPPAYDNINEARPRVFSQDMETQF